MTECLSISSSSEVIDDELAGEGGVADRGLEAVIGLKITAGLLAFRAKETGASWITDI